MCHGPDAPGAGGPRALGCAALCAVGAPRGSALPLFRCIRVEHALHGARMRCDGNSR